MKAVFVFLFAFLMTAPAFAQEQSVHDKILAAKEIKCGYAVQPPHIAVDVNTKNISGLSKDLTEALAKKIDVKVTWAEEAPWGSIIEGLSTKRYDMICVTLGALANRAKVVDFSQPIFYLPIYAISRADDKRFDKNLDALNDPKIKIGVLEGEYTSILAKERYPKSQLIAIPQMSDYSLLLEDIKAGKSDISFISGDTFDDYNKKNAGVLKITNGGRPIIAGPAAFGLPKGDYAMKRLVDVALDEMYTDGTIEGIFKKYDPTGKLFLLRDKPYRD